MTIKCLYNKQWFIVPHKHSKSANLEGRKLCEKTVEYLTFHIMSNNYENGIEGSDFHLSGHWRLDNVTPYPLYYCCLSVTFVP